MSTRNKTAESYSAPALVKGLEILELLSTSPESMTLTEIARALGRSSGEQFRMLAVLQRLGYIRRNSAGAFALTLKLYRLAQQTRPFDQLLQAARGPMRRFSELTGQECHLSALEDGRLVVLAQQSGTQAVTLLVRPGSAHHPAKTVSGRLLLSQLSPEEAAWHLERAEENFSGAVKATSLKTGLSELRGYCIGRARDESLKGVSDVAVRVGGPGPPWSVALASSCFHVALTKPEWDRLISSLIDMAERIESELGLD